MQALVDGAQLIGASLVSGTQDLIDGTAAAQQTLADALRGIPPVPAAPPALQRQAVMLPSIEAVPDLHGSNMIPLTASQAADPSAFAVATTDPATASGVQPTGVDPAAGTTTAGPDITGSNVAAPAGSPAVPVDAKWSRS